MSASSSDFFKKARRKFSTTIGVGGFLTSATTLPLTDVTGIDSDTGVIVVIDSADSAGNPTPTKEEVIAGVLSGSSLVSCLRGLEGTTNQDHQAGAQVTMYFTESHWDSLINGILTQHNQDGTHKTITQTVVTLTDGTTITPDASQGNVFKVTLGGNRTMAAPLNPVAGQKILFRLKQDATGSRTIAWNAVFRFPTDFGGSVSLSAGANVTDYIGFIYNADATKWDCLAVVKGY